MKVDGLALAHYGPLVKYRPRVGDFIVWTGWLRTWYGLVSSIDGAVVSVVFETIPVLLFTLTPAEQQSNTRSLQLQKIIGARCGTFAVCQHDRQGGVAVWYV